MLNLIAAAGSGGDTFIWHPTLSPRTRDSILRFAQAHDTLSPLSRGTDPHGWRNALNAFGWGAGALPVQGMVYVDATYPTFQAAIRAAVRQMVLTRKPVGVLAWAGHHAQILTGYYGLHGDPLAKNANGTWADRFTVDGVYLSDPLRADAMVNRRVSLLAFAAAGNLRLRFRPYYQTDSPYLDPYTGSRRISWRSWYGQFTLELPTR